MESPLARPKIDATYFCRNTLAIQDGQHPWVAASRVQGITSISLRVTNASPGETGATDIPLTTDHVDVQQCSTGSMRRKQPPVHGKPYWVGAFSGVVANKSWTLLANVRYQCATMVLVIFDRCCHIVDGLHHLIQWSVRYKQEAKARRMTCCHPIEKTTRKRHAGCSLGTPTPVNRCA